MNYDKNMTLANVIELSSKALSSSDSFALTTIRATKSPSIRALPSDIELKDFTR